jgi:hypothetical protein
MAIIPAVAGSGTDAGLILTETPPELSLITLSEK